MTSAWIKMEPLTELIATPKQQVNEERYVSSSVGEVVDGHPKKKKRQAHLMKIIKVDPETEPTQTEKVFISEGCVSDKGDSDGIRKKKKRRKSKMNSETVKVEPDASPVVWRDSAKQVAGKRTKKKKKKRQGKWTGGETQEFENERTALDSDGPLGTKNNQSKSVDISHIKKTNKGTISYQSQNKRAAANGSLAVHNPEPRDGHVDEPRRIPFTETKKKKKPFLGLDYEMEQTRPIPKETDHEIEEMLEVHVSDSPSSSGAENLKKKKKKKQISKAKTSKDTFKVEDVGKQINSDLISGTDDNSPMKKKKKKKKKHRSTVLLTDNEIQESSKITDLKNNFYKEKRRKRESSETGSGDAVIRKKKKKKKAASETRESGTDGLFESTTPFENTDGEASASKKAKGESSEMGGGDAAIIRKKKKRKTKSQNGASKTKTFRDTAARDSADIPLCRDSSESESGDESSSGSEGTVKVAVITPDANQRSEFEDLVDSSCDKDEPGSCPASRTSKISFYNHFSTMKDFPEEIENEGIVLKSGWWTKLDEMRLRANFENFCKKYNVKNPRKLVFPMLFEDCQQIVQFQRKKRFTVKMCRGINRTPYSVYVKIRKVFNEDNYRGRYTSDEKADVLRLRRIYGNRWWKIGHQISRSGQSVLDMFLRMKEGAVKGKWNEIEKGQLLKGIKETVTEAEGADMMTGIPWRHVHKFVPTRTMNQCQIQWKQKLCWLVGDRPAHDWLYCDSIRLVETLYDLNVNDENDIDWVDLHKKFMAEAPSSYKLKTIWYRLKFRFIPKFQYMILEDIFDEMKQRVIPTLRELSEQHDKRVRLREERIKSKEYLFYLNSSDSDDGDGLHLWRDHAGTNSTALLDSSDSDDGDGLHH